MAIGDRKALLEAEMRKRGITPTLMRLPGVQSPQPNILQRFKTYATSDRKPGESSLFGETTLPGDIIRNIGKVILPETYGQLGTQAALSLIPGGLLAKGAGKVTGKALSPLLSRILSSVERVGQAAVGGEAGSRIAGEKPQGGTAAEAQALVEAAVPIVRNFPGVSRIVSNLGAKYRDVPRIMEYIKSKVPAWSHYPSNALGLAQILAESGQSTLSKGFDTAVKSTIDTAAQRGVTVASPALTAAALRLGPEKALLEKAQPSRVREAVDALNFSKLIPGAPIPIRQAYDMFMRLEHSASLAMRSVSRGNAINVTEAQHLSELAELAETDFRNSLPQSLRDSWDKAMGTYKMGKGFMEFGNRSKMLQVGTGEPKFSPAEAAEARIRKPGEELRRRGLQEMGDVITGQPIGRGEVDSFIRPPWPFHGFKLPSTHLLPGGEGVAKGAGVALTPLLQGLTGEGD